MHANPLDDVELAVEARGLVKRFGDVEALCGVDLTVERATVLGVLGPNGAGKTTAVRILTTLLAPDGGQAFIDGIDVAREPRRVRARIGLTGQYAAIDERLTGLENLVHVGRLLHLSKQEARTRAHEMFERFDLTAAENRISGTYSGGMRRRLDIAMSLVGRPSVLFLDEPTTGLDPRSRNAMWDTIEELVRGGTTTLLTTQYLEEADRLADQIAVIDRGVVIERGTPRELKRRVGGEQIEVAVSRADDIDRVFPALAEIAIGEPHIERPQRRIVIPVRDVRGIVPHVVRRLDDADIALDDVGVRRSTLDDVFFSLTGHGAEDDHDDGSDAALASAGSGVREGTKQS